MTTRIIWFLMATKPKIPLLSATQPTSSGRGIDCNGVLGGRTQIIGIFEPVRRNRRSPPNNLGWEWIQSGLVYPYVNNVSVYHCPADTTYLTANSFGAVTQYPRVRSMSMNTWLNPIVVWGGDANAANTLVVYRKESDTVRPGPANLWVLIDENPAA